MAETGSDMDSFIMKEEWGSPGKEEEEDVKMMEVNYPYRRPGPGGYHDKDIY